MALGWSPSLDLIFMFWNYNHQGFFQALNAKVLSFKGQHGSSCHWPLARLLATRSEGPVQSRDLGALKFYLLPNFASSCPQTNQYCGKFQAANTELMTKSFRASPTANLGACTSPIHHLHPHTTSPKAHLIRIPIMLQQSRIPRIPLSQGKSNWIFLLLSLSRPSTSSACWALGPPDSVKELKRCHAALWNRM